MVLDFGGGFFVLFFYGETTDGEELGRGERGPLLKASKRILKLESQAMKKQLMPIYTKFQKLHGLLSNKFLSLCNFKIFAYLYNIVLILPSNTI